MRTDEARIAWSVGQSHGAWGRAGMGGALTGFDWSAALALAAALDPDAEPMIVTPLLQALEEGALAGAAEQQVAG